MCIILMKVEDFTVQMWFVQFSIVNHLGYFLIISNSEASRHSFILLFQLFS